MICFGEQLGVSPSQAVFVGDDVEADVEGARAVGLATVRVTCWCPPAQCVRAPRSADADIVVNDLREVPGALSRLVGRAAGSAEVPNRLGTG